MATVPPTGPTCQWCHAWCCMAPDDCSGQQSWMRYWDGLTPTERREELAAMDAYANDPDVREANRLESS